MDKLAPLIRHRFWILFGLALPLALAGYFLTSGKMTEATEAREQELEKTLKEVPQGSTEPNDTYAAGLKMINERLQADNKVEVQKLWEDQRERMHWPTVMLKKEYIPDEHREEILEGGRRYYVRIYPDVIKRVWEKAQPVVGDPPPYGLEVTWDQKLLLLPETLPIHNLDTIYTPTNKQIWDAQEDVWLLDLIFDGIVRTNKNAASIMDATVRSVDELFLTGGSGEPAVLGATGTAAGGGIGGDFNEGDRDPGVGGFAGGGNGGGGVNSRLGARGAGGAGGMGPGSISFNPAEEFGMPLPDPELAKAAGVSGGGAAGGGGGMMMDGARFEDEDGPGFGGLAGGRAGGAAGGMMDMAYRYIGNPSEVENAPFRERGFYMSVIVELSELPRFFAEMSSLDWPIRILRFQIGPNPYAPTPTAGSYAGARRGSAGLGRGGARFEDEDYGGFGRGLGRSGSFGRLGGIGMNRPRRSLGGGRMGSTEDYDTGGGRFGRGGSRGGLGGQRGGIELPLSMQGPAQIDPNWFADPDLVQVDFCGIITMYNPQTDDTVVPTDDGSSADATPEALAKREEELQAAAEEAAKAEEAAAAETPPAGTVPADESPGEPASDAGADSGANPADPAADTGASPGEGSDTKPPGGEAPSTEAAPDE